MCSFNDRFLSVEEVCKAPCPTALVLELQIQMTGRTASVCSRCLKGITAIVPFLDAIANSMSQQKGTTQGRIFHIIGITYLSRVVLDHVKAFPSSRNAAGCLSD